MFPSENWKILKTLDLKFHSLSQLIDYIDPSMFSAREKSTRFKPDSFFESSLNSKTIDTKHLSACSIQTHTNKKNRGWKQFKTIVMSTRMIIHEPHKSGFGFSQYLQQTGGAYSWAIPTKKISVRRKRKNWVYWECFAFNFGSMKLIITFLATLSYQECLETEHVKKELLLFLKKKELIVILSSSCTWWRF